MFAYIRGRLISISPEAAIVDVSGIGYKIFIPVNLLSQGLKTGDELTLHTAFIVREDSHRLFGFASATERNLFEKLSAISGIGPKTALSIIGHMSQNDLLMAVQIGNAASLTHIPGIGKKTAERIILELSGDRKRWQQISVEGQESESSSAVFDATSALINLGYSNKQASSALQKVLDVHKGKTLDLPVLIRSALQHIN